MPPMRCPGRVGRNRPSFSVRLLQGPFVPLGAPLFSILIAPSRTRGPRTDLFSLLAIQGDDLFMFDRRHTESFFRCQSSGNRIPFLPCFSRPTQPGHEIKIRQSKNPGAVYPPIPTLSSGHADVSGSLQPEPFSKGTASVTHWRIGEFTLFALLCRP